MSGPRYITVHVATELLAELRGWSPPLQVRLDETPGIGTGWELTFRTVPSDWARQLVVTPRNPTRAEHPVDPYEGGHDQVDGADHDTDEEPR